MVEEALVPDEVVADAGKGDDVDPYGVEADLLEGGRGKGRGDAGVEGVEARVVTV